jgi:hypothetical protein
MVEPVCGCSLWPVKSTPYRLSRQVFAEYVSGTRVLNQNSPLALIMARHQTPAAARAPLRLINQ